MFEKVIVADDLGSINQGVVTVLDTLGVKKVEKVHYCDDAYLKIKSADLKNEPYQLLITDLSFRADYRTQKFPSGESLIEGLKKEDNPILIIVYSIEDRLLKVRHLVKKYSINAYVCKGRKGLIELSHAINRVFEGEQYLSPQVQPALNHHNDLEIEDFDILLLKKLALGHSQDEISRLFKKQGIQPSSLSSIEKRLNRLKIQFKANNAIHLVSITKDLGLI